MACFADLLESRLLFTGNPSDAIPDVEPAIEAPATITGVVIHDLNGNGVRDPGEPGLAGWQVWIESTGNNRPDPGELAATSGPDGAYRIEDIPPGRSDLTILSQAGWWTLPNGQVLLLNPGEVYAADPFVVGTGGYVTGGVEEVEAAGGPAIRMLPRWTVYIDLDDNSSLDAGEPSTQTTEFGWYHLGNVPPGTYTLRQVVQLGYRAVSPESGSHTVTVWEGQGTGVFVFSNTTRGEIRGSFFRDLDRDGVRDAGEPGLPNWTAYIDANNDGRRDFPEPVAFGDEDGNYAFTGLAPGTYTVRPWSETDTLVRTGPPGGDYRVTIAGPEVVSGKDFGYARLFPARVSGRRLFYADSAFDTPLDDGEPRTGIGAAAPDKRALLPGQAATFANVSSYARGVNGLILDVYDLANPKLTADDFEFSTGPGPGGGGGAGEWVEAPPPESIESVSPVYLQSPLPELDRVVIRWAPGAIVNSWLRVTIKTNNNTGLREPDVFYFGSLLGETGDAATPARVSAVDLGAVKRALNTSSPLNGRFDFDRDGRVGALDLGIARHNLNTLIPLITAPPALPAPAPSPPPAPLRSVAADIGLLPWEET